MKSGPVTLLIMMKILTATSILLPSTIPKIILNHFGQFGCSAYFCSVNNAASFSKASSHKSTIFQSSVIRGSAHLVLDRSRMGIFLDTKCPEGLQFLQKNKQFLNSSYNWLLWSDRMNDVLNTLERSRLNIDSDLTIVQRNSSGSDGVSSKNEIYDSFILTDVYRKHDSMPIETVEYEMWRGGSVHSLALRSVRNNLNRFVFSGSIWLPTMNIDRVSYDELTNPAFALNVDVRWRYGISLFMTICRNYMNCSVQLVQAACNDESKTSPCNGSVGVLEQVRRGKADFAVVPLTWDVQSDVEYSLPVLNVKLKFLFLQPKMIGSCLALLRPLSTEIWVLLAVLLVLTAVAFKIVSPFDETSQHNDGWVGSAFLVLSALAQQGVPDNTYKLTTRIIYISVLNVTFFAFTYYGTALLNSLLLPPPNSITSAADLFNSRLTVGLAESALIRDRLSQLDSLDGDFFEKVTLSSSADVFKSAADGVQKIVHEPFAIFGEEIELRQHLWLSSMTWAEVCSVGLVDDVRLPQQASFVLPRNSPYKEFLRRGIVRSRERGAIDRLKTDWLPDVPECLWQIDGVQFGFEPLAVAYVIETFGVIASLVILVGEKVMSKSKMQTALTDERQNSKKLS